MIHIYHDGEHLRCRRIVMLLLSQQLLLMLQLLKMVYILLVELL